MLCDVFACPSNESNVCYGSINSTFMFVNSDDKPIRIISALIGRLRTFKNNRGEFTKEGPFGANGFYSSGVYNSPRYRWVFSVHWPTKSTTTRAGNMNSRRPADTFSSLPSRFPSLCLLSIFSSFYPPSVRFQRALGAFAHE